MQLSSGMGLLLKHSWLHKPDPPLPPPLCAQERERLTVASESAVRLRMKRNEASAKEQALASFLDRWKPKLMALLGPNLPPAARMR